VCAPASTAGSPRPTDSLPRHGAACTVWFCSPPPPLRQRPGCLPSRRSHRYWGKRASASRALHGCHVCRHPASHRAVLPPVRFDPRTGTFPGSTTHGHDHDGVRSALSCRVRTEADALARGTSWAFMVHPTGLGGPCFYNIGFKSLGPTLFSVSLDFFIFNLF
jgi:hypothetical protein